MVQQQGLDYDTAENVMAGYIVDAGKTEVASGTITVGFVGPDTEEKINKLTGQLKCL